MQAYLENLNTKSATFRVMNIIGNESYIYASNISYYVYMFICKLRRDNAKNHADLKCPYHDDVIRRKHFPRYRHFVRGINR